MAVFDAAEKKLSALQSQIDSLRSRVTALESQPIPEPIPDPEPPPDPIPEPVGIVSFNRDSPYWTDHSTSLIGRARPSGWDWNGPTTYEGWIYGDHDGQDQRPYPFAEYTHAGPFRLSVETRIIDAHLVGADWASILSAFYEQWNPHSIVVTNRSGFNEIGLAGRVFDVNSARKGVLPGEWFLSELSRDSSGGITIRIDNQIVLTAESSAPLDLIGLHAGAYAGFPESGDSGRWRLQQRNLMLELL